MYIQLLNEAIHEKKDGPQELFENKAKKVLSLDAYIPASYVTKDDKIDVYKEIDEAKSFDELSDIHAKINDIYGSIPDEVERLFTKRRLELYQDSYWFNEYNEYNDRLEIKCSKEFSNIDGIGFVLFNKLQSYLRFINVKIISNMLHITVYKNDD